MVILILAVGLGAIFVLGTLVGSGIQRERASARRRTARSCARWRPPARPAADLDEVAA